MAKDPAFLFYYQDFLVGTDHMTDEQIGQYVKCLCHQANRGSVRPEHMKNICKTHENHIVVTEKFKKDANGDYYNQRLREEVQKRKDYAESRRNNRKSKNISSSYEKHMENEIVNENVNTIKGINDDNSFDMVWEKYPNKIGKKAALRHFKASVKTAKHLQDLYSAIENYKRSAQFNKGFVMNGSTFFNNWADWVKLPDNQKWCEKCKNTGKFVSDRGYECTCECAAGKRAK